MTLLLVLLPALCLFGGALLYLVPLPFSARARIFIPLLAFVLSGAAVIAAARASTDAVALHEPSAILPGLVLALQWNGPALPLGLFMLALLAARLLAAIDEDDTTTVVGTLCVAGSALLFLAADNFTTVAAAWIIVELCLLIPASAESDARANESIAFGWNLAAIVLWLGAGMILFNQGISLRLAEATFNGMSALLIFLALWIRGGFYPLHAAAPSDVPVAAVRLGVPFLLAGYLMTRLLAGLTEPLAFDGEMQIVVVLAIAISAFLVVAQPHGTDAFTWLARAFGATLLALPFLGDSAALAPVSVWWLLGAFALCVWVSIAWSWRAQLQRVPLTAVVWIIGLIIAACLPLSPAFWGRVGVLNAAYADNLAWWVVLVASAAFYLLPLWREIFASREIAPKAPSVFEYAALGLGAGAIVSVTFAANFFMGAFGISVQENANAVTQQVFSSASANVWIFTGAGFVVPLLFAFELARRRMTRASFLPAKLTVWFDLSALTAWLDTVYRFARALVQQSLALLEQPPIAWLLFLAIWVAVWINGLN